MSEVVDCMVTCNLCGLVDLHVYVPVRKEGQDVVDWMNNVFTPAAVQAHQFMSPHCRPTEFTTVKIPMSSKGPGLALTGDEPKEGGE